MTRQQSLLLISSAAVAAISILYFCSYKSSSGKIYTAPQAKQILDEIYADISGFSISPEEREIVESAGGNPTYGEITFESVEELIKKFSNDLDANGTFFDLGCGVGKACAQVALRTPARAIGVELCPTRHQLAQKAKQELINRKILTDEHKLEFREQNILDADLSSATFIFMCATCFSDDLMQKLADKIAKLHKHLHVATLRQLPPSEFGKLEYKETLNLPMTWSANSPVYIYELVA